MKVRCFQIINPNTRKAVEKSQRLSIGTIYHVLAVFNDLQRAPAFRLLGDDGHTPALHNAENFEIVSSIIPQNWRIRVNSTGAVELGPESWMRVGFWEDYFDGKAEALKDFSDEREATISCDP